MMKNLQVKFIQKEKYKMKGENRNSKKDNNKVIHETVYLAVYLETNLYI